jgi:hypothetical protein
MDDSWTWVLMWLHFDLAGRVIGQGLEGGRTGVTAITRKNGTRNSKYK